MITLYSVIMGCKPRKSFGSSRSCSKPQGSGYRLCERSWVFAQRAYGNATPRLVWRGTEGRSGGVQTKVPVLGRRRCYAWSTSPWSSTRPSTPPACCRCGWNARSSSPSWPRVCFLSQPQSRRQTGVFRGCRSSWWLGVSWILQSGKFSFQIVSYNFV